MNTGKCTYESNFLNDIYHKCSRENTGAILKLFQNYNKEFLKHRNAEFAYATLFIGNVHTHNFKITRNHFVPNVRNFQEIPPSSKKI